MSESTLYLVTIGSIKRQKTAAEVEAVMKGKCDSIKRTPMHGSILKEDLPAVREKLAPHSILINDEATLVIHVIPAHTLIGELVGAASSDLREHIYKQCREAGVRFDITSGNLPRTLILGESKVRSLTRADYERLRNQAHA